MATTFKEGWAHTHLEGTFKHYDGLELLKALYQNGVDLGTILNGFLHGNWYPATLPLQELGKDVDFVLLSLPTMKLVFAMSPEAINQVYTDTVGIDKGVALEVAFTIAMSGLEDIPGYATSTTHGKFHPVYQEMKRIFNKYILKEGISQINDPAGEKNRDLRNNLWYLTAMGEMKSSTIQNILFSKIVKIINPVYGENKHRVQKDLVRFQKAFGEVAKVLTTYLAAKEVPSQKVKQLKELKSSQTIVREFIARLAKGSPMFAEFSQSIRDNFTELLPTEKKQQAANTMFGGEIVVASIETTSAMMMSIPLVFENGWVDINEMHEAWRHRNDNEESKALYQRYVKAVTHVALLFNGPSFIAPKETRFDTTITDQAAKQQTSVEARTPMLAFTNLGAWRFLEAFGPKNLADAIINDTLDKETSKSLFIPFGLGSRGCDGSAVAKAMAEQQLDVLMEHCDNLKKAKQGRLELVAKMGKKRIRDIRRQDLFRFKGGASSVKNYDFDIQIAA